MISGQFISIWAPGFFCLDILLDICKYLNTTHLYMWHDSFIRDMSLLHVRVT